MTLKRAISVKLRTESLRVVGSSKIFRIENVERKYVERKTLLRNFSVKKKKQRTRRWQKEITVSFHTDENYSRVREKAMINRREETIAGEESLRMIG